MSYLRTRNFDGRDHRGWNPYYEYEAREEPQPAFDSHGHGHHKNKHVAFKTKYDEETMEDEVGAGSGSREKEKVVERASISTETVDDEADAFIKQQHRRIELAKLMSIRAGSHY